MFVDDEDEFAAACADGSITSKEAAAARTAADEVEGWLADSVEPFGQVGWEKLRDAVHLGLSPLEELPDAF